MKLEHSLARGATRLIVVDAITHNGQLRVKCKDEDGDSYMEKAIWMYEYEKHDDYHNSFDWDRFNVGWRLFYLDGMLCTLVSPLYKSYIIAHHTLLA